jgi:hypothetical protein
MNILKKKKNNFKIEIQSNIWKLSAYLKTKFAKLKKNLF